MPGVGRDVNPIFLHHTLLHTQHTCIVTPCGSRYPNSSSGLVIYIRTLCCDAFLTAGAATGSTPLLTFANFRDGVCILILARLLRQAACVNHDVSELGQRFDSCILGRPWASQSVSWVSG